MSVHVDHSQVDNLGRSMTRAAGVVNAETARAVRRGGDTIADLARQSAPVLTGALKSSVEVRGTGLTAEVIASVDYAAYVEFGTSDTPAQPFLAPAFDAGRPLAERAIVDAAMKVL